MHVNNLFLLYNFINRALLTEDITTLIYNMYQFEWGMAGFLTFIFIIMIIVTLRTTSTLLHLLEHPIVFIINVLENLNFEDISNDHYDLVCRGLKIQ